MVRLGVGPPPPPGRVGGGARAPAPRPPPPPPPRRVHMGNGTLAFVPIDAAMGATVWPIASARASPDDRILIPLFATVGFLPYLKNTLCSFRRVRLEHWIVIAMDNATCPALARTMGETAGAACIHPYAGSAHFNASAPARYRSKVFNLIVMQRPTWVRWLLARGLSILQCDLDVVFVKDPLPDLRRRPTADMQFQSEQVYGQNGGFYFARPTNASIGLIDRWISRLAERANSKSFEEQHALNHALKYSRTLRRAGRLNVVKLNDTQYPNGKIWWQLQRSSKVRVTDASPQLLIHATERRRVRTGGCVRGALQLGQVQ